MSQYFENDQKVSHKEKSFSFTVKGEKFTFQSDNGVFSKNALDEGSELLINTVLNENIQGDILDLGCGVGVIGLTLQKLIENTHLTLSDVNDRALALATQNADALNLSPRVNIVHSDLYQEFSHSTFDVIISNPPIRAGKKVTYEIYRGALEHLKQDGSLIIVIRKKQGAESVYEYLKSLYSRAAILKKKKGYYVIRAYK